MQTFYEHQQIARENSSWMLFLLAVAIGGTTMVTGLMITLWLFIPLYLYLLKDQPHRETLFTIHFQPDATHPVHRWLVEQLPWLTDVPWELFVFFYVVITLAVGAAIVTATRNRMRQIREAGGIGLAESIGGVCVTAEEYRRDDRTQRAVNVVQEIAIASRIAMPHVYLLHDEPGINAFAVGFTARDMTIGLTAGCLEHLNREQLQGVVSHEFAHIANGDTYINLQLVGYLHGLMTIIITADSLLAKGLDFLVHSISRGGHGAVGMACIVIGALLWPVGLVGLCAATVVKAAYSRQREFLADASAIEFSRNSLGLANAMKRILAVPAGSRVQSPKCLALSHVFFAKSCTGIAGLLDSHPDLKVRIRRVDQSWDGEVQFEEEHEVGEFKGVFQSTLSLAAQARDSDEGRVLALPLELATIQIHDEIVMEVNRHATAIRSLIPADLWGLTTELEMAETLVFALWAEGASSLDHDDAVLTPLEEKWGTAAKAAAALQQHIKLCDLPERLMLFDASINRLRHACQTSDLSGFCRKAEQLLKLPEQSDLFRWAWNQAVGQLVQRAAGTTRAQPKYGSVKELLPQAQVVLSALAYANHSDVMEGYSLLRAGNVLETDFELLPREECSLDAVDDALQQLQLLAPKSRRQFLLAGSASIETDAVMNEQEALLMRGICSALGYPPATLLPGQPVKMA